MNSIREQVQPVQRRILVLEDEALYAEALAMLLASLGWEPHTASNLTQAQDLIERLSFGRLLLDVNVGIESGLDFYASLPRSLKERTVFMSGASLDTAQGTGRPALKKPFRLEQLERALLGAQGTTPTPLAVDIGCSA